MSELYQLLRCSDDIDLIDELKEALANNDLEGFQLALDMGADPLLPFDSNVCVYEMALSTYGREAFVQECFQNHCSPHYVNQRLNKAAINYAADSMDPEIIHDILVQSKSIMVNNKFSHLTPLNSLAVNVHDDNVDDVILCIKRLIRYGASKQIPDNSGMIPSENVMLNANLNEVNKKKIVQIFEEPEYMVLPTKSHVACILYCERRRTSICVALLAKLCQFVDHCFCESAPLRPQAETFKFEHDELFPRETDDALYNQYRFFNSIKHKDNITYDEIMTKGIDYNFKFGNKSPLECALSAGNSYALNNLLNQPKIYIQAVKCPFAVVIKNMKEDSERYRKCFFILLKNKLIDINETDDWGSSALHFAVETRNSEAINELLKRGAFLGAKNKSNTLGMEGLCPALLKECFDNCISSNHMSGVCIKYDNLRNMTIHAERYKDQKEMPTLSYMAKSEDYRHLLDHPVISTFLNLKWSQLSAIFYINFLMFIFFAICVMTHTTLKFNGSEANNLIASFRITSWIGIVYMILRECIQLITLPRQYFRSLSNYLELLLIALSICNSMDLDTDRHTQKVIAVATLLLVAVELFLLCGCLPILSMSTYMLMLQEVCKRFAKSFLLYSIFVVTFSICFYILFGTENGNAIDGNGDFNKFTNPLKSLVKTVVMLAGEFDAGNIEFSSLYSYLLFLLFVFLMTIVLYNLLNGLAVSDIQTIMRQAKQNGTRCRIELLTRYEEVILGHSVYWRLANPFGRHGRVPNINRETLEIAMNILEQNRLASKKLQRWRNNENRFNSIDKKLANIFKKLNR